MPTSMVDHIREALRPTCNLDPFSVASPSDSYEISSVYLDGPDLPFHRAKTNRENRRLKLRVRHYPDAEVEGKPFPAFLEIKRRVGDIIIKRRAKLDDGRRWAERVRDVPDDSTSIEDDFRATLCLYDASPKIVVRYSREAWVSWVDDYARVTFDTNIQWQEHDHWTLAEDAHLWRSVDDGFTLGTPASFVIVEMKFAERIPAWMEAIGRRFDLFRRGFSKYCTSINQRYLLDHKFDLSSRRAT